MRGRNTILQDREDGEPRMKFTGKIIIDVALELRNLKLLLRTDHGLCRFCGGKICANDCRARRFGFPNETLQAEQE